MWIQRTALMACLIILAGCVTSLAQTPGERFRNALKEIEGNCAKHKLEKNEVCGKVTKLKPADPLATEEGRFAHSIKIPNPVPEDSGYKPGMTPQEYFDHLCKTEAGEFIFKAVENVDGLYMMRPRKEATDDQLQHLYALEDPYGYTNGEATGSEFLFVEPNRYQFFEMAVMKDRKLRMGNQFLDSSYLKMPEAKARYERYFGYNARKTQTMIKEFDTSLRSRFGFTWRGIIRPHDRELGIAGGELIVMDLQTNEVLGVRRGYIRSGDVKNLTGIGWLTGRTCPQYNYRHRNKDFDFSYWFVGKVLKPINYEQSFKELTNAN
ncbi:hypothetical protein [Nitrospira sp. Nam74]